MGTSDMPDERDGNSELVIHERRFTFIRCKIRGRERLAGKHVCDAQYGRDQIAHGRDIG